MLPVCKVKGCLNFPVALRHSHVKLCWVRFDWHFFLQKRTKKTKQPKSNKFSQILEVKMLHGSQAMRPDPFISSKEGALSQNVGANCSLNVQHMSNYVKSNYKSQKNRCFSFFVCFKRTHPPLF